jgi:putative ABC transport system permease protein
VSSLALASVRHRRTAFLATFVTVLLGTGLIGSFATLVGTATGPVSGEDRSNLLIMGAVVGGWGTVIVLFSLASTLGIVVRQRGVELGLLRMIGATNRQVGRLVRAETLVVSVVAAAAGVLVAAGGGWLLLHLLTEAGVVGPEVEQHAGAVSWLATATAMVVTALVAASVAARRATRGTPRVALAEADTGRRRLPKWRLAVGVVLVAYGVAMAAVTVGITAHSDDPYDAMATSGNSGILVGVGLATLSPLLLRWAAGAARPFSTRHAHTQLALEDVGRRPQLFGGVLAPVVVLTAATVSVLMLVNVDNRSLTVPDDGTDVINLLNYVIVAMISLFAAVMVVNAWVTTLSSRRLELARLRLLGATPAQVRGHVLAEAGFVSVVGVLLGLLASTASWMPFAVARHEGVVPDGGLWLPPLLMAGAAAVTLVSAALAVRHTSTGPMLAMSAEGR